MYFDLGMPFKTFNSTLSSTEKLRNLQISSFDFPGKFLFEQESAHQRSSNICGI